MTAPDVLGWQNHGRCCAHLHVPQNCSTSEQKEGLQCIIPRAAAFPLAGCPHLNTAAGCSFGSSVQILLRAQLFICVSQRSLQEMYMS